MKTMLWDILEKELTKEQKQKVIAMPESMYKFYHKSFDKFMDHMIKEILEDCDVI